MNGVSRQYYLNALGITAWKSRQPISQTASSAIHWLIEPLSAEVAFLADWENSEELELLRNIAKACAKDKGYAMGKIVSTNNVPFSIPLILVFGMAQASKLAPSLTALGIYKLNNSKIVVTYSLKELQTNPAYKKALWKLWQTLG